MKIYSIMNYVKELSIKWPVNLQRFLAGMMTGRTCN
ncbi:hypothetical protein EVA_22245 [gut metagenome]|uniref:Uncharacterized protein n=1 Tax=gut metagenome TaxID=749906 RepID=J9BQ06_9ZZZZ